MLPIVYKILNITYYIMFVTLFKAFKLMSKLVVHRPTDRKTDIATYRAAFAAKNTFF
jgi:hypothetical protein